MTLFIKYSNPGGTEQAVGLVAIGSNIRFGDLGLSTSAELGQADMSTLQIDDPGGIWTFAGLRAIDVRETAAASNNQMIGRFIIQARTVGRNPDRGLLTQGDRMWTLDLEDYNWHIGKRIFVDSDANRPAETAGDRLRWLLNNAAHITMGDFGHVTYPTAQLDAHDYRGEDAGVLLADCAIEDQYTFWNEVNEAREAPELFFMDPDSSAYASTLTVSNVLTDYDGITTFFPTIDAELARSPDRVAGGVFLPYTNGYVYGRNTTTATNFALVDRVAPMATVHSETRARRLANKFLAVNNEEDDRITFGVDLPIAQVNDIRTGHRLFVRFLHLPGYESGRWTRVLHRSVLQQVENGGDSYRLLLEVVPSGTFPPPTSGDFTGSAFAGIQSSVSHNGTYGTLQYTNTYDAGSPGWDTQVVTGPMSIIAPSPHYYAIQVSQGMIVRIYARAWATGVAIPAVSRSMYVKVNGVVVGTDTHTLSGAVNRFYKVDLRNVSLSAGDVVSISSEGSVNWSNTGTNGTQLIVGRGSFPLVNLASGADGTFTGP